MHKCDMVPCYVFCYNTTLMGSSLVHSACACDPLDAVRSWYQQLEHSAVGAVSCLYPAIPETSCSGHLRQLLVRLRRT